jgi:hypothetical protein
MSALFSAAVLYAGLVIALQAFAAWTERDLHAFPFKQEDWLRYLLPSHFEAREHKRIMLNGPSTVRENLRYERFEAAFPGYDIYQGGISAGTLEDVTASLEYIEKVYGASALPTILVLGISPRFIANLPDDRPFALGLNRYSPYYSTKQEPSRLALQPKSALDGALARARFLTLKEPERFRISFVALANRFLWRNGYGPGGETTLARGLDWLFKTYPVARLIDVLGFPQARQFSFSMIMRWMISPYKFSLNKPIQYRLMTREEYNKADLNSVWRRTYDWDPANDEATTRARLKYLVDFVKRHGIRMLVINLPERDFSRVLFDEHNYQAYLDLVRDELGGIEFINLRDFLDTIHFYDREHTTPAGSARLSDEVIRRMRGSVVPRTEAAVTQGDCCVASGGTNP